MRKILICTILLFSCSIISAQKNVEKSESFTEFDGWTKLLQLRNNNTGLMEVTKKMVINFKDQNSKMPA